MLLKAVYDVRASVFGFDPLYGITAFYLSPENSICGYVHEGFDCVGTGKYASGLSLGMDFKAKTLMMRQAGYDPVEGVFELLVASLLGVDHFKETGGTLHMVLLDAKAKSRAGRYREIFDEPARLCAEAVRGHMDGLLGREAALDVIERVVFKGEAIDRVEKDMFEASPDPTAFRLVLRGYKKNEAVECSARSRAGGGEKKPGGAKGKAKKKGA